jgi:LacI family transcriptional regulator
MAVTLKMIAAKSGVSVSTVSHVLGSRAHLFNAKTRDKVLAAARDLDYKPNAVARAMRSGKSGTIALLLSTTQHTSNLPQEMLRGIETTLAEHDLQLSLTQLPDEERAANGVVPRVLRERLVDGLLINMQEEIPASIRLLIAKLNLPSISLNCLKPSDTVHPDDMSAGYTATRHLLDLGHRRIAYASYSDSPHYSMQARIDGYEKAMREAGLAPRIIHHPPYIPHLERIAVSKPWLKKADRPSAVITYSAGTALPILLAASVELGLRVPQDLSLVTFSEHLEDTCGIALTTMILPEFAIGQAAVKMLLSKMASPAEEIASQAIDFALATGQTCAPPPSA